MRLANIFLAADGRVWMIDFGFSELAASDLLLANDVAELFTSSWLAVGPERAVARRERRGAAGRPAPVRRPPAAMGAQRRHPHRPQGLPGLLDDLRARVQAAPPEPDRGLRTAG